MDGQHEYVRRYDTEKSYLEVASRLPAPGLRDRVRRYTGFRERGSGPLASRELPSGEVALVLSFGPSLTITDPGNARSVHLRSFVAGLHDSPVATESGPEQHGIEVRLTPIGAYALVGTSMPELRNRAVPLEELFGAGQMGLADRLQALPTWGARFRHLDHILAEAVDVGPEPSPSVVWAWRRLTETSGTLPISTLTTELGCTRKHLAERFRREMGASPKALGQVLRFNRAIDLLSRRALPLADVALHCGYADQAHFSRDFRRFAGATPSEFRDNPALVLR